MKLRHWIIAVVTAIIILPATGIIIFVAQFDPNRYAPELAAAISRATGRQLVLGSPIHLKLSLTPTIEVSNVSLKNPPGFTDPNLLTLKRVEAQISLLPLLSHRLNIIHLLLVSPSFYLETNAAGQTDWDFSTSGPAIPTSRPAQSMQSAQRFKVALESVEIQDGLLTIKGVQPTQTTTLALTNFAGTADSGSSPLRLTAQAVYNGTPFTVLGTVGPVERFSGTGTGPWPVDLVLDTAGATAMIKGAITEPRLGRGYDVTVDASVPALEAMAPILPPGLLSGGELPKLHDITASARIVDQNATVPAIDNLSIKAGASDLSGLRPGLALASLDIEMASLDKPLSVNATGSLSSTPLSVTGNFGAVQGLLDPALLPASMPPQVNFPVSLQIQAGDAKLGVTGAIATPARLSGVALAVNASIPDLSTLDALAGMQLPAWKNIQLQTTLTDPDGLGLRKSVGMDSLALTMDNASLGGDASLYFGAQPRLEASLTGQQINLDALLAAWKASRPAPTPLPVLPPAATAVNTYVIPAQKIPLGLLKTPSADVQLSADSLIFNKATYSAIQGHAVLANGVLTISPFTGNLPGGSISASASLDTTKDPAIAKLSVTAPALALAPFLKAAGLPDTAQGTMQAAVNMTGTGDSLHDIAASMNGQLGLAMVNGIVDGSVLDKLFGTALRTVGLPANLVGAQGPVEVRCFGLRMDANNGVGTIRALTLDSSRLLVQGGGTINFGPETLAIVLHPQLRFAGNPIGVPVEIGGTFANPVDSVAPLGTLRAAAGTATGLAGTLASQIGGNNSVLGNIAAAVGLGGNGDVCPAALNLGRLGKPGPAAATAPKAPARGSAAPTVTNGPKNLLNSLFGK